MGHCWAPLLLFFGFWWLCRATVFGAEDVVSLRGAASTAAAATTTRALATKVKKMKLQDPNIFMIGAMKAGTTSLSDLMRSNPHICDFGEKEKHFFSGGEYENKYDAEVERYKSEFSPCKDTQLTMDSTPGYSADVRVIERIRESYDAPTLRKQKYLYILREPISRHYSEYQMNVRLCIDADGDLERGNYMSWRIYRHERSCEAVMDDFDGKTNDPSKHKSAKVMTFHEWCLSKKGRLELRRGLYKEVIVRYLHIIGREQLFFVNFDTLIHNTSLVMTGFNTFLEMPDQHAWDDKVVLPVPKKAARRPKLPTYMDCTTVLMLDKFFKKIEGNFFGWLKNLTALSGKAPGEPEFEKYTSDPYKNCVHKYNWTGPWKSANYWNSSNKEFPKETWTFVQDSVKLLMTVDGVLGPNGGHGGGGGRALVEGETGLV